MEGGSVSKYFNQIVTNSESRRHDSTAFTASETSRTSKRAQKGVQNNARVYNDDVDNHLQHLSGRNRGSIKHSTKHKRGERQKEAERQREFSRVQEEERHAELHRQLDVVWQREWKKLQKALRQEEMKRRKEAEMEQVLHTLKQTVLKEWAKTTSQQMTTQEIQKEPLHPKTKRLGEQEAVSEGWTRTEREDERGEKARERGKSFHPKQDRQQMSDIEHLSKPLREEDKRMEHIARQRLASVEADRGMTTDTLNKWETTGSSEICRDLASSYKMERRGDNVDNAERDRTAQLEKVRKMERLKDTVRDVERMSEMKRQRDIVRNQKNTTEIERLAEKEEHQMVRMREINENEREIERELEEDQTRQKEKLSQLRIDKGLMDMETESCESQRVMEMNIKRELDEEQVRRYGPLDAWPEEAEDGQPCRMRKGIHHADLQGTPMSSALLVLPTVTGCWTDEVDAMQKENTKVQMETDNLRTDQPFRALEWENTPCPEAVSQTWNQSLTRESIVTEDNVWIDRMEEQKESESNIDVKRRKKPVDEEVSQRVLETPQRDPVTQREYGRLNRLERKSGETVKAEEHIEKAYQEPIRQLQEEREEHLKEKKGKRERLKMQKVTDLWRKNDMETKEDTGRQKKPQRDEQKEKENQLEVEKLKASRGQWETGKEKQNEMHKQSDMQYLEGPKVAAKAQIQKNAKLSEVSGWSSVCRINEREAIKHLAQRKEPRPIYQPTVQTTSIRKPRTRPMRIKSHTQRRTNHSSNPKPVTVKVLSPSADEMTQDEIPGATETTDEPSDVVAEGGIARSDKSLRQRILGWINEKAKNYYQNKIYRTFAREMEEGDQVYQSRCVGSPISRAEREQQKRWALLKGEVRRQHLEELWMKMEAEKAKKKRKKKQGTDDTLWFCEDITSKGYTREQFRNTCAPQDTCASVL